MNAAKYALLWANGATFQEVLDQHAEDLAEALRYWNGPEHVEERWTVGVNDAADYIDPSLL